jgi:hypothetical protein
MNAQQPTQADIDAQHALADAVERWAPQLHIGASGIDPVALLRAIAAQETTDATRWAAAKHENAYCYGGRYQTPALKPAEWRWGCAAHCSWGPWQIMYPTAALRGFADDPVRLRDPMVSGGYVVAELNAKVFDSLPQPTVQDCFDAWNSGTARDNLFPATYVSQATDLYNQFAALTA